MSEVPLISTKKQAELLQSSDISKEFFENTKEAEQLKSAPLRYD